MNYYVNQYDYTGNMSKTGMLAENTFVSIFEKRFKVVPASYTQQIKEHIDYIIYDSNKFFTVDVKAKKKFTKEDKEVWIEFKNVNGNKGWIYGNATMIAFERENDFILVGRSKLKDLCESLVDLNNPTKDKYNALYKAYTRENRKDVISKIMFKDIIDNLKYTKIDKNCV